MIAARALADFARNFANGSATRADLAALRKPAVPLGPNQAAFVRDVGSSARRQLPASALAAVAEAVADEQPDLSSAEALANAHDLLSDVVGDDPWIRKGLPRTFEELMDNGGAHGRLLYEAQHGPTDSRHRAKTLLRDFRAAWDAATADLNA